MVSVVGDDRSGDPLHGRCDESDVYEGEVAQVDMVLSGARIYLLSLKFNFSCVARPEIQIRPWLYELDAHRI